MNLQDLEAEIARSVRNFEPRIVGDTLVVRAVRESSKTSPSTLVFEIRGESLGATFSRRNCSSRLRSILRRAR